MSFGFRKNSACLDSDDARGKTIVGLDGFSAAENETITAILDLAGYQTCVISKTASASSNTESRAGKLAGCYQMKADPCMRDAAVAASTGNTDGAEPGCGAIIVNPAGLGFIRSNSLGKVGLDFTGSSDFKGGKCTQLRVGFCSDDPDAANAILPQADIVLPGEEVELLQLVDQVCFPQTGQVIHCFSSQGQAGTSIIALGLATLFPDAIYINAAGSENRLIKLGISPGLGLGWEELLGGSLTLLAGRFRGELPMLGKGSTLKILDFKEETTPGLPAALIDEVIHVASRAFAHVLVDWGVGRDGIPADSPPGFRIQILPDKALGRPENWCSSELLLFNQVSERKVKTAAAWWQTAPRSGQTAVLMERPASNRGNLGRRRAPPITYFPRIPTLSYQTLQGTIPQWNWRFRKHLLRIKQVLDETGT